MAENETDEKRDEEQEVRDTDADVKAVEKSEKVDEEQEVRDTDADTSDVIKRISDLTDSLSEMRMQVSSMRDMFSAFIDGGAVIRESDDYEKPEPKPKFTPIEDLDLNL